MLWLIIHEWILLLLAFLLGLLIGRWIWDRPARAVAVTQTSETVETADTVQTAMPAVGDAHAEPAVEEVKPELFDAPTMGPPDDLKKISGIGPKYESLLNEIGVYYYQQIRDWTPEEIAWLDSRLEFPGRIVRENWQDQASVLAEGGSTEFASRYDRGETPSSY